MNKNLDDVIAAYFKLQMAKPSSSAQPFIKLSWSHYIFPQFFVSAAEN
jgi:hypothetical protein